MLTQTSSLICVGFFDNLIGHLLYPALGYPSTPLDLLRNFLFCSV